MALSEMNSKLFRMINNLGKQYTDLNPFFVFIAEYMIFFLVLAVLMFLFSRRNKNRIMVICAFITLVISELLAKIAGQFHSNNQPFAELPNVNRLVEKAVNNSFPSDHTIIFFSFCITFWLFKRGWGILWVILAVLVGISRIWIGVHYPADVLVGAIISIVSATIVYKIVLKLSLTKKFLGNQGEPSILSALSKQKKGKSKDF
ncbi:undecaprenyl-diphosphatase [Peribacillus simplex]|uniref:Undecaprenyl-diphosphatase YbjG n=1 Tax=Peribacillus simplex TaxID=1478 RepID=A0A9W4LCL3_9BACI|nr:undecaprenyl-diphosphatase [Peribacillus simplex]MDR4929597.1 undecaprenyl-diphosphatase [Peribacillus simplex]WHX90670.1 undecaprenyl-diphosphatase [Peribacillus simplex]CAH0313974.1 Putative undecaprenyl-diphosphatase YbjG [Peribacillus simplex]